MVLTEKNQQNLLGMNLRSILVTAGHHNTKENGDRGHSSPSDPCCRNQNSVSCEPECFWWSWKTLCMTSRGRGMVAGWLLDITSPQHLTSWGLKPRLSTVIMYAEGGKVWIIIRRGGLQTVGFGPDSLLGIPSPDGCVRTTSRSRIKNCVDNAERQRKAKLEGYTKKRLLGESKTCALEFLNLWLYLLCEVVCLQVTPQCCSRSPARNQSESYGLGSST